ncbi:YlbF family regulator [Tumebacillus lipolyticus]|uniref:YlbF family regulator n=1 Tax=Tumebacillus lipolyticus TaxID=1280370 RepID=A0ABW4ZY65_9BACL
MTTLDRNEIWAQAFELGEMILRTPEVDHYKQCEQAMLTHPELGAKVSKFKEMQEQYDRLAEYSQGAHLDGLRKDMKQLQAELDTYPEVQAYKQAMQTVDDLLKAVTDKIAATIVEKSS